MYRHLDIFLPDKQMPYSKTNTITNQNYEPKAIEYLDMTFAWKLF